MEVIEYQTCKGPVKFYEIGLKVHDNFNDSPVPKIVIISLLNSVKIAACRANEDYFILDYGR